MIQSSSTSHVWRCYKLILSLAECCGSTFVRDLKNDETNEVENAYGIFIPNLPSLNNCIFFYFVKDKKYLSNHEMIQQTFFSIFANKFKLLLRYGLYWYKYIHIPIYFVPGLKSFHSEKQKRESLTSFFTFWFEQVCFVYKLLKAERGTFLQT